MDVAYDCAEFWILYSGSAVGGYDSHDWNADDSKDMCLRMDCVNWIFCHETGMPLTEAFLTNSQKTSISPSLTVEEIFVF